MCSMMSGSASISSGRAVDRRCEGGGLQADDAAEPAYEMPLAMLSL
jgi:hypothetical protein